jgi:hypothetical protein
VAVATDADDGGRVPRRAFLAAIDSGLKGMGRFLN